MTEQEEHDQSDAEMDRLNSALVDAWAERDAALAEARTLRETLDPLHQTLSFLRSVIASGEPMSPDVRQAIDSAQERLRLADTEEAKSDGEWYCEADAVGITTTHCSPENPIHTYPCGWKADPAPPEEPSRG